MNHKNLRLPVTLALGVGEEQKKTLQEHWNTLGDIETNLQAKGFVDFKIPDFECPELNEHVLTSPDSKQYTEVYVHLLAWYNFMSECYAKVEAKILQLENMQEILGAQTRKMARDVTEAAGAKKPTVEEMKDRLLLNPEYLEVMHELQQQQQSKVLMGRKVDALERSLRLISRQVEIRKLDIEQQRTATAMPMRGQHSFDRENRG